MSRTANQELDALNLKATARQVTFWCERGYIKSSVSGSGSTRTFSAEEKRALKLMDRLVDAGFRPESAHTVMRAMLKADSGKQGVKVRLREGITLEVRW